MSTYGTWPSPVTAERVVESTVRLGAPMVSDGDVYWGEGRPGEGGRQVAVRFRDGVAEDVTPPPFNVRSRVHEYGGSAFTVVDGDVYFVHFDDQRLYKNGAPLTPEPVVPAGDRFSDFCPAPGALICVRERHHDDGRVDNEIVAVSTGDGTQRVLATGRDFVAAPRLSPDGSRLAWLEWDHPNMPWDAAELWVADLSGDLGPTNQTRVAGGGGEAVFQPEWSPDGVLHYVSDRTGWWNLYRTDREDALVSRDAEFGAPLWQLGANTYAFFGDGRIACAWSSQGRGHLGILTPDGTLTELDIPFTVIEAPRTRGDHIVAIGASPTTDPALVLIDPADAANPTVVRAAREAPLEERYISVPNPITFPTTDGDVAHALYYAPHNPDVGSSDGAPPLLVLCHGGPTGATTTAFTMGTQFWTTRGFAVVDVNYRGSTGYGRVYRDRLKDKWGVYDVDDCVAAAHHLAGLGLADAARLLIRGASAGGWTTLCALAHRDVFAAGGSYFGVADAALLAAETHKFESRYLDGLIGPWPDAQDVYEERSALASADRIDAPLIVFQGLEDKIVPPNQAEMIVAALDRRKIPHAYVAYEGEGHGFRRAESMINSLEAELYFYRRVLDLEVAEGEPPVKIEHL